MARHAQLNWDSPRGKWKVVYQGKKYRFDGGTGRSDREAKKRAEAAWKQKRAEIDCASDSQKPYREEYESHIEQWNLVLQWSLEHGDQTHAQTARDAIARLRRGLSKSTPSPPDFCDRIESLYSLSPDLLAPLQATLGAKLRFPAGSPVSLTPDELKLSDELDGSDTRILREKWEDRISIQRGKEQDLSDAVETRVEAFLKQKRVEANAGQLSAGRCDVLRVHLHHFRDWLGAMTSITKINGKIITNYHSELVSGIEAKRSSAAYAKDHFGSVKSFVRWLWTTEAIESLPRVLGTKNLKISAGVKTPAVFTFDEIGKLLKRATDRTKLYILLMLNAGMTQKDICDLLQSEVDWKAGTITRKRSKTASHDKVPTVQYRLWPETIRLLLQARANDGDHVLLNTDGGPLKVEVMGTDGKLKKIDNVASAFSRLRRITKIQKPSKLFRKTSATLLRGNKDFAGIEVLFLGHAPTSISDRHYAQAPQELLNEGITWLGQQYKLVDFPDAAAGKTDHVKSKGVGRSPPKAEKEQRRGRKTKHAPTST